MPQGGPGPIESLSRGSLATERVGIETLRRKGADDNGRVDNAGHWNNAVERYSSLQHIGTVTS